MRVLALLLALATLVGLGGAASALPAEEGASTAARPALQRVGSFSSPTYVTAPPGDRRRLFVTERSGRIRVMRDGRRLATPFLDITARVQTSGESGLLSMAFAPDYERSRRFYVYYVDRGGNIRIDELRRSRAKPDRTERGSRRTVILQRHRRSNHKGGQLQFGPDGLLYMAFGDGGGEGDPDRNAQSLRTRLGKVLRIDPRRTRRSAYRIPRSNPFARRRGARREIYALGLRNPYRFSFDRLKGHLLIGDVGAAAVEEVDLVRTRRHRSAPRGGQNFGWSVFEGRRRLRAGNVRHHHRPALQRLHSQGVCSITGGYVIRDPALGRLRGRYVYGDLCDPRLRITGFRNGRARGDKRLGPSVERLVSFGEDARGRIYTVSLEGAVSRLVLR